MSVKEKAKKIRMLALDIDGVLTDGRIIYDERGKELKCFNVLDGMGLALLKMTDIKVALITAKGSGAVLRRAKDIGAVEVKQNSLAKGKALSAILKKYKLKNDEVCFVGDDLVDVPALKKAGLAVAVSNSCAEAKKAAHYVTRKKGGKGAVREIIEIILRAQGKWRKVTAGFLE
ncbi:MAG: HAD hydrolase family protein [Candidatus Omnitrophica bacterium]|nr:HAD hydrolase family protein [Candidatus Omnitrophota bacterium]